MDDLQMYGCSSGCQMGCRCGGYRDISLEMMNLSNQMRLLWEQHVYWTRMVISGIIFNSPDVEFSKARLLRNPGDFAEVLKSFYGEAEAMRFAELFTSHLTIAAQLVSAANTGKSAEAAEAERKWYENADQIAAFFASINPYWAMCQWQQMLYSHLAMTKQEAVSFISKNYGASIDVFEKIEQEALEMADMMTRGIILQFSSCFDRI